MVKKKTYIPQYEKLKDLTCDKLYKLYWEEGKTTRQIAEMFGVSHRSICVLLDYCGIPRKPGRGKKWTKEEEEILLKYWPNVKKIAELTGRTIRAVIAKARQLGLDRRQIINVSVEVKDENALLLGILIGFILGDGSISIKSHGRRTGFVPVIEMASTDPEIIDFLRFILKKLNISYIKSALKASSSRRKLLYYLCVVKRQDVRRLIEMMLPYLVGIKRKIAELVLKYIELRDKYVGARLSPEEIEIVEKVRKLTFLSKSTMLILKRNADHEVRE